MCPHLLETEEEGKVVCDFDIKALHYSRSPHLPYTRSKRIWLDGGIRNLPGCHALRKTLPFLVIV